MATESYVRYYMRSGRTIEITDEIVQYQDFLKPGQTRHTEPLVAGWTLVVTAGGSLFRIYDAEVEAIEVGSQVSADVQKAAARALGFLTRPQAAAPE